jgi:hypothetical protein
MSSGAGEDVDKLVFWDGTVLAPSMARMSPVEPKVMEVTGPVDCSGVSVGRVCVCNHCDEFFPSFCEFSERISKKARLAILRAAIKESKTNQLSEKTSRIAPERIRVPSAISIYSRTREFPVIYQPKAISNASRNRVKIMVNIDKLLYVLKVTLREVERAAQTRTGVSPKDGAAYPLPKPAH